MLVNPGLSSRGRRACGGAWACATVVERRRRLQVRRASTASSGSLHAEVTRYRYTVRWRIAWSISYATRFPPRSRVPWYVRGSRTTVSKENSSSRRPPAWRGRVGGACNARTLNGRSLRAHVRGAVRPRSASRAGGKPVRHSGLWAVIATAPVKARSGTGRSHGFRVSVCSRLDGCGAPGAPGRCIFADAPRPRGELTRIGDHLPQKPRIAGPASLPGASPLVARGAPARTGR